MATSKQLEIHFYNKISFYMLAAVLFLTPMFQGLFFRQEIYRAGLFITGLFLWYLWTRRETLNFDFKKLSILDVGVLGLLVAYVTSSFTAVKILDAVDMDLKMAIYLMVYIIVIGLSNTLTGSRKLLWAIYISGLAVSLIGIAAFAGFDIKDGVLYGRISSTFQYPNALGAYLAAIGIVGIYLLVTTEIVNNQLFLSAGNVVLFTSLFGTSSRGTFLALAAAYLIFILFQPALFRLKILGTVLHSLAFGGATYYLVAGKAGSPMVWGLVTLMTLTGTAIYIGFNKLTRTSLMSNKKTLLIAALIILGVGIAVTGKMMDNTLIDRLANINLKDRNVVERGYFYSDALEIIKAHPVLGVGGGGWGSIYKAYQSYGYTSTQVHNFYLQTWVEAGIFGLLSIILIIAGALSSFIKKLKSQTENRALNATVAAAVLVVALQSAIDFTLSYGAIAILIWTLFAILRTPQEQERNVGREHLKGTGKSNTITLLAGGVLALGAIILSSSLIAGFSYEEKSVEAIAKRDNDQRLSSLGKSVAFNPFYADNYVNLALMERKNYKMEKNPEHLKKALDYTNKAISRDKGNPLYRVEKINILLSLKNFESAVKEAEAAFKLAPWDQESYNLLAHVYLSAGTHYIKNGDKQKGHEYLNKAVRVPKILSAKMKTLTKDEINLWAGKKPVFDKKLQQYVGQAAILLTKES